MKDTSLLTAACRAKFCSKNGYGDEYAAKIVGDQINMFDPILAKFPPGSVDLFTYRMTWTDERTRSSQVVLLGAGMDSFAGRFPNTPVYEVDLEATQAQKRSRVKDVYDDSDVIYVSCDFETQDFMDRLVEAGFDVTLDTTFIWMGVTYYLTRDAVTHTLKRLTSGMDCDQLQVLFDYAVDIRPNEVMATAEGELAKMKEPIQTKFADITPLLYAIKGDKSIESVEDVSALSYIASEGGDIFPDDKRLLRFVDVCFGR